MKPYVPLTPETQVGGNGRDVRTGRPKLRPLRLQLRPSPPQFAGSLPSPPRSPTKSQAAAVAPSLKACQPLFVLLALLAQLMGISCPKRTLLVFVEAVLARSKATPAVLQISLLYLIYLQKRGLQKRGLHSQVKPPVGCIRRLWLTCLILASKFAEDQNYTLKTWAHITGLSVEELRRNETAVLVALDFDLSVDRTMLETVSSLSSRPATPVSVVSENDVETVLARLGCTENEDRCSGIKRTNRSSDCSSPASKRVQVKCI